jgi:hypothetical protein
MNEDLQHHRQTTDAADPAANLDARILRALEHLPEVQIPANFAARVAANAPAAKTRITLRPTHYGRNAMIAAMLVLFAVLLAFAPRSVGGSPLWLALNWIFCAQFLALGVWFGLRLAQRE